MNNMKWITYGFVPLLGLYLSSCAHTEAQSARSAATTTPPGYVLDSAGKVVRDSRNDCVHNTLWSRDQALAQCDGSPAVTAASATPPVSQTSANTEEAAQTDELPPPAPAQTAEIPADDSAAIVAAPEPSVERVYLGADTYFEFNQAELRQQAHVPLDKIVARAKDGQNPAIEIVGHADQIGDADYNLTLSQRRADAVRAYFVEQGIPEDSIRVEARGESDPIVRCEGQQGSALIGCLQPNRRSEIIFTALEAPEAQ